MKTKFLPAFLFFMFLAFTFKADAQGGVLPLNNSVNGNLTSATPDVWNVTTTSDGLLRLTFTTVSPADLYMTLYDNDGTTVIAGPLESYNNSTVTINADGLAAGTYHVKITPFSTAFGTYTLADSLFVSALAKDVEPNGTAATALVLPQNGSKTGNVGYYYNNLRDTADWYKVTTTADGLLRVYLSTERSSGYSTNTLDVNVTLYDNNATTQLGSVEVFNANGPAANLITTDGLAPGTYYIKVQPYTTSEFANYTLSDTLFQTAVANDVEPNGNAGNAIVLPQNGKKTGHGGYYYNNQRDTADWYKVTTTTDGLLRVYLSTERGSTYSNNTLDANVYLYDNDGATLLGQVEVFNANEPATNFISTDGLAPGTYYIKVQPYTSTEFINYTITDSLFTTPVANDSEPNGTAASATVLPENGRKTGHGGYYYNNQRDTADWYKVTTTTDGLLRVYLSTERGSTYSNNTLDANVYLYDNDGTTLLGQVEVFNANGPATNIISTDGLAPGTYYIKVQPYTSAEFMNYTITDSLFMTPVANDIEPNSTAASATVLPQNGSKTGHGGYYYNNQRDTADWYKVTTTADGLLRVYLSTQRGSTYSSNTLDAILYVYDNNGAPLLGQVEVFNANGPATNFADVDGLAAGTYYIKVQPYSSAEFMNYTISDSLFTSSIPNDAEPNGSPLTAITLPINSGAKGHSGYYYNNQRDTADWYKIIVPADGPLHFYLSSSRSSVYSNNTLDMIMTVYNSDGTTQIGSKEVYKANGPALDSLSFADLAAGTYFLKVTNYSTNEFAFYSVSNSVQANGGALPVTFIDFAGTLVGNSARLTWSTATEANNKGFEVEKSADGQKFSDIGFVKGNGTSALENNYNYTDVKVLSGYNYYRLKQIDIDGNFSYSSTIRLDFKHFDWAIFGNPVTSNSWIQLQLAKTSNVAIQVMSIDGKVMKTINKGTISQGTYSVPLALGKVPSGIYIIKLLVDDQNFSKQVIK